VSRPGLWRRSDWLGAKFRLIASARGDLIAPGHRPRPTPNRLSDGLEVYRIDPSAKLRLRATAVGLPGARPGPCCWTPDVGSPGLSRPFQWSEL